MKVSHGCTMLLLHNRKFGFIQESGTIIKNSALRLCSHSNIGKQDKEDIGTLRSGHTGCAAYRNGFKKYRLTLHMNIDIRWG